MSENAFAYILIGIALALGMLVVRRFVQFVHSLSLGIFSRSEYEEYMRERKMVGKR